MIEILKQALEALEDLIDQTEIPPDENCSCHIAPPCSDCVDYSGIRYAIKQASDTITSLRQAIAGLESQEPFGYFRYDIRLDAWVQSRDSNQGAAFYTHPPQRTWVGLTDEEIEDIVEDCDGIGWDVAQAIREKLKEKNT
jgi:hypothetical protein